jgi:hypothetical protein
VDRYHFARCFGISCGWISRACCCGKLIELGDELSTVRCWVSGWKDWSVTPTAARCRERFDPFDPSP